jgi:hypothetical protein
MLKHPVWRALIAVAVALVVIELLGRVMLSLSWLTTLSWAIAWVIALAAGTAVFVGLGRPASMARPTRVRSNPARGVHR